MTSHDNPGQLEPSNGRDAGRIPGTTVVDTKPIADPGIEEHVERWTDVDEGAARRSARNISALFLLAPVFAIAYVVIYFAVPREMTIRVSETSQFSAQTTLLGACLGLALLCIGVGAVQWARQIMTYHEEAEERHPAASSDADREAIMIEVDKGITQSGVSRRQMILRSLGIGVGALGLPAIISLADLGPWPTRPEIDRTIATTIWSEGVRLVNDVTYTPIRAADLQIGQLVNAQPANLEELHGTEFLQQKAKAAIIIVRMNPNQIVIPETRRDWHVNGILCYSKICTHVGCPISLWEQQTHHLLCPCHQSTFDLGRAGIVVFGPASRALPQLPITVDGEGYLIARSGFVDDEGHNLPTGPSYFERDSTHDLTRSLPGEGEN